ncbi:folate family ECF transporter S component [Clostridium sp. YIM B02515]|uniref:Folate family ECF transporter S component n=1 Tax=Clostridium rhizosphaerae TaxID=2803861 RepID=A0ABS1TCJ9_9CLOT|nr:folate family ECF transporter S component [Clostridium rhizosphaerae]MBL4935693.1 folate family ECF transporter S component [Clostridium rhizosphaerae]
MNKTRKIILMGLFIAIDIVLTRFLSIQTPIVRISFDFLPIALAAIMFGPLIGGTTAAIADLIGMMLFPKGAYFPGFTLSAFLTGAIYGIFLYKKTLSTIRVSISVLTIKLFIDLGLNTLWLHILLNKAVFAILPTRIISNAVMLPIQVIVICIVYKALNSAFKIKIVNEMGK